MIQCRYKRCNCIPCMRCKTKTPDGGRGFSIPIFGRGLISRLTACCRSTCQAICRYNALLHLPKQIQKTMILEPCMHPLSLDWRWQQLHYSIQTTRSPRNLFHEVPFPANQCLSSCDTCPWPHSIMLKPCNFFENVIQCKHKWGNCMSCMRCRTKTPDGRRGFSIPIFGRGLISRLTACCRSICQAICRYNASLHLPKQTQKMRILESCMHPLSLDWRWQQLHYSI